MFKPVVQFGDRPEGSPVSCFFFFKLHLKLSAVCQGDLSNPPTWTPFCLLSQTVCFVAVVFVWLVCSWLMIPYDVTQVTDDHMWPCDSMSNRRAAALAALPMPAGALGVATS